MNKEIVKKEVREAILGELKFRLHGQVADINGVAVVLSEAVMKRLEALDSTVLERKHRENDEHWKRHLGGGCR